VSFAKSTLHASRSGIANVAPLPFKVAANAGDEEKINAALDSVATIIFLLRTLFFNPMPVTINFSLVV
jgi:hypothetical protein